MNPRRSLSLHPLAACLALVLGAPGAGAAPPPTALVVQNCLDHGPGSLRQAVVDAAPGEPIDLTQLGCSTITLTTGSINVSRAQLIQGPGPDALTIDGAGIDRVFTQASTDPLALYGMTIQDGYVNAFGGGCIYSAGILQLNDTVVRNCRVADIASTATYKGGGVLVGGTLVAIDSAIVDNEINSALGIAIGGGAAVGGAAILDHSTISGNLVSNVSGNLTSVGGIDVGGALTMTYSTVANNRVGGLPGSPGSVGGLRAAAGATIMQSTVSGNSADGGVGGLRLYGTGGAPNTLIESTISGNSASAIGGLYARGPTTIRNSTIAFNRETGTNNGGGLRIAYAVAELQSTIIAANTSAAGQAQNIAFGIGGGVSGANNLIGTSPSVTLPPGTIGGDPMLLPLADNGGPTRTHALRAGSPAEDAGNNASGDPSDQRGTGFPRGIGPSADIGAFEGVDADAIFFDGFD